MSRGGYTGYVKHGLTKGGKRPPEYAAWRSMKERCLNPNHKSYHHYGGRGISICGRWLDNNGFGNFISDMGLRPSPKHSIDRYPNNDGNYEPSNCRWATTKEQCNNRRSNSIYTHNGISKTISEWADFFGITSNALNGYLIRNTFESAYDFYSKSPEERLLVLYNRRKRTGIKNKKPIIRHNLIGKRFTDLLVIRFHGQSKKGSVWECLCDCGKIKLATTGHLHEGRYKSCGCQEKTRKYAH